MRQLEDGSCCARKRVRRAPAEVGGDPSLIIYSKSTHTRKQEHAGKRMEREQRAKKMRVKKKHMERQRLTRQERDICADISQDPPI